MPSLTAAFVVDDALPLLFIPASSPLAMLPANWLPMLPPVAVAVAVAVMIRVIELLRSSGN
ncbi:hypothetical protein [Duffyella gerundensis]|uniref:hypothetical protein n=1 Tax=Duffyella gerundensis TaxID=1619313 RepID=UPI0021F6EF3D|nr:hypothetical protein [Duffyella gerundensis]